ncbi:MAG: hypothetical protein PVG39_20650 [Desulfobacteraceae bacterium]|jgi:hypothetical protein
MIKSGRIILLKIIFKYLLVVAVSLTCTATVGAEDLKGENQDNENEFYTRRNNSNSLKDFYLKGENEKAYIPIFNSNWSERHVAYICGLDTFGCHTCIITKKSRSVV